MFSFKSLWLNNDWDIEFVTFPHIGCVGLNPQRQIYDDSAVYTLSDSSVAFRTEVKRQ